MIEDKLQVFRDMEAKESVYRLAITQPLADTQEQRCYDEIVRHKLWKEYYDAKIRWHQLLETAA